jgi:peptide deformylase
MGKTPVPLFLYGKDLRRSSEPVTEFNQELRDLVDSLFDACHLHGGIGLAAPQCHIFKRVAVIHIVGERFDRNTQRKVQFEEKLALINPVVIEVEGEQVGLEGCLSIPGQRFHAKVKRPHTVVCRFQDIEGTTRTIIGEDLLARALCHEVDHLDGKLYIDYLGGVSRHLIMGKFHKLEKQIMRQKVSPGAVRVFPR